jgi:hypothetical protein
MRFTKESSSPSATTHYVIVSLVKLMEKIELEYKLTPADFQAFDRYVGRSRRWIFWLIPVAVILPNLLLLFTKNSSVLRDPERLGGFMKSFGMSLLIPTAVMVVFWLVFLRRGYEDLKKKSPELFETRVTQITPEFMINRDSTGEVRTFWSAVKSVVEDETHIFVMLKDQVGFILPKNAFQNASEASLFFQTARRYWKPDVGNPW